MGNNLRKQLEELQEQNKKLKAELLRSYKDNLTGLWNRNFFDKFAKKIEESESNIGVIYIDANKLKFINDNMGHSVGDQYLKDVGDLILSSITRRSDFAFRLGGDEFLVILALTGDDSEKGLDTVLDRIDSKLKSLNEQRLQDGKVEISIAVGSTIKKTKDSLPNSISKAEDLMYKHKAFQKKKDPTLGR